MSLRHLAGVCGAVAAGLSLCAAAAYAEGGGLVNGVLRYRDFTIDMSAVATAANLAEIETSVKKQVDIVADCGASAPILAFFRRQRVTLSLSTKGGSGHFTAGTGVTLRAVAQPPKRPILLHELMHAMHNRYLPGGNRNRDVIRFFQNARRGHRYPEGSYVLSNVNEFFAVTASLYLWGFVDRPPNNRETLRKQQPYYYAWLGRTFGVQH